MAVTTDRTCMFCSNLKVARDLILKSFDFGFPGMHKTSSVTFYNILESKRARRPTKELPEI